MSLIIKEATILQATIQSLVGQAPAALLNAGGQVKAYRTRVSENIPLPYIVYTRLPYGGLRNSPHNQDSDSMWRIVVTTSDWEQVDTYADFIGLLHRTDPITSMFAGVSPVSYLEALDEVEATTQPQNTTVFEVGGIYRIRLYFGATEV